MSDDFQLESSPQPNLSRRKKKKRLKNTLNDTISNGVNESESSSVRLNMNFLMKSLGLDGFVTVWGDSETERVANEEIDEESVPQHQIVDCQRNINKNTHRNSNTIATEKEETILQSDSMELIDDFRSDKESELIYSSGFSNRSKPKNKKLIKSRFEYQQPNESSTKSKKISTEFESSSELQNDSSSIFNGDSLRRIDTDEIKLEKEKKPKYIRKEKLIESSLEYQQPNESSMKSEKISTESECSSELQNNSSSIFSGDSLRRLGTDEIKPVKDKKFKKETLIESRFESEWLDGSSKKSEQISMKSESSSEPRSICSELRRFGTEEIKPVKDKKSRNETLTKSRLESEWLEGSSMKSEKISTEPESSSELQSNSSSIFSGDSLRRIGTDEIKPVDYKKSRFLNSTDIRSESDFDYKDSTSKKMENELLNYLPEGKAKVMIISWNMAGISNCPEFLNELFKVDKETETCDLFLLCFQETTNNKTELLIRIQSALGSDYVIYDQVENKKIFVVLAGYRRFIWNIKIIGKNILSTRITTITKGVAAISFYLFGSSFLFLGSHFSSDMDKNDLRLEDYKSILYSKDLIESLTIPSMKLGYDENNISHYFDYTIWAGDLNFRINLEDSKVRNMINKEKSYYNGASIENLLENDELLDGQINGTVFQEFEEGRITFMPTYKFIIGKNEYHESRIPAYTDRILFRSHVTGGIDYLLYKPVQSFVCSDHKPVQLILEVSIARQENESFKALGRFNNEIYEKYQSISSNNATSQSRTCSIQ